MFLIDWIGQEGVASHHPSLLASDFARGSSRVEDNRNVPRHWVSPQSLAHLKSAQVRKIYIKQYNIRFRGRHHLKGIVAAAGSSD
jgi:hypothetical protein